MLDPFAGRGTSVFSAATQKRSAIGIEINPVGFVYAKAKLTPASRDDVAERITAISRSDSRKEYAKAARLLPQFFHYCFVSDVRRFLVAARDQLDWRRNSLDRTVMALILVYLHGKEGAALSNQMRQTKSMSPAYAIRWWIENKKVAPEIDPAEFLISRLDWRYAKGTPECIPSRMYLGDNLRVMPRLSREIAEGNIPKAKLLFTSPPYQGVTNYHYDQWLRLWMLGGQPNANLIGNGQGGKFDNRENYSTLLETVFSNSKALLHKDATIYVRTDTRKFTRETTIKILREQFKSKSLKIYRRPLNGSTQTQLFGDHRKRAGEIDIVLQPY